jgi:hypothetical protein
MAFVDVMLRESEATFTIVDKRAAPGGHWNDAYPFVRLHQPSASYGVFSRELGKGRKDQTGFNQGLYELASGFEVADYFHQLMRDTFLPSGRVTFLPVSEVFDDDDGPADDREWTIAGMLSGERRRVRARKLVDATMLQTSIPVTHKRAFAVAEGVECIPPNDLIRAAANHSHFTVLGSGKTALDSLLWLLANGAKPEAISWVLPRDPWLFNRASFQPGGEFFEQSMGSIATQYEISAKAASLEEVCKQMEAHGLWMRLDPDVWPTMFHGATVTLAELEQLRRVRNFIRKGRVQRLERTSVVLDGGEAPAAEGMLYVDCTARALHGNVNDHRPVFSPGRIRLQMIRQYQPTFSAALIAHLEATIEGEADKQALARGAPMTDTVEDWARSQVASMINQGAWGRHPDIAGWLASCRLDLFARSLAAAREDDSAKSAVLGRISAASRPAAENLTRLTQATV